jgi:hypothetical protein
LTPTFDDSVLVPESQDDQMIKKACEANGMPFFVNRDEANP